MRNMLPQHNGGGFQAARATTRSHRPMAELPSNLSSRSCFNFHFHRLLTYPWSIAHITYTERENLLPMTHCLVTTMLLTYLRAITDADTLSAEAAERIASDVLAVLENIVNVVKCTVNPLHKTGTHISHSQSSPHTMENQTRDCHP